MIQFMMVRPEDLTDERILKSLKMEARKGRLVVMKQMDDSPKNVIEWMYRKLLMCKGVLYPGRTMHNVRLYLNAVAEANAHSMAEKMKGEKTRSKYICLLLGAMVQRGVFAATASELARTFRVGHLSPLSIKKYICCGQKDEHLIKIFELTDKVSPDVTANFAAAIN